MSTKTNKKSNREQLLQRLKDCTDELEDEELEEIASKFTQKKIKKDNKIKEKALKENSISKQSKDLTKSMSEIKISNSSNPLLIKDDPSCELQLKDVDSDGNCLWYALSISITGHTNYYRQLKTYFLFMTILQYDSIQEYIPDLTGQQYYDEYIQERVWGNIDHIGQIIANSLGRQIAVYHSENLELPPYIIYGEEYKVREPIRLFYSNNHYKVILKINVETQQVYNIDNRNLNKIMLDIAGEFFTFRNFSKFNNNIIDKIDDCPEFYQQLHDHAYGFTQFVEYVEEFFDLDLKYIQKTQNIQQNSSKKKISVLQLPSKIFEKCQLSFDFNCCNYKQQYPLFKESQKQDSYNEKFKHLMSISDDKKKSEYNYPDRIKNIQNYRLRANKMNKFRNTTKNYEIKRCGICQNQRLVFNDKDQNDNEKTMFIPYIEQIQDILSLIHNTTHRKRYHMIEILNRLQIIIPNFRIKITQFISNCQICSQDPVQRKRPATKQIVSSKPMERIQMDCMELHHKLHQKGYIQLLNIKDHFSRFSKSYPIKNKKAETITDCLQDFFNNQGVPDILQTDNGLEFNNQIIKDLCEEYSVDYIRGRPYHPQSQGSIERFNRWIHRRLIQMCQNQEKFDLKKSIYQLVFDYNNTVSRITKLKPIDAIKLQPKNKEDSDKIQKIIQNVQSSFPKCKNPLDFNIGDKALLSNETTNSAGKNVIIKKPTLQKKSGQFKLFNIAVTITKVNNLNVCIKINSENQNNLFLDQDYICPVQFLKLITKECWEKFCTEKLDDDEDILEMIEDTDNINDDSEESSIDNLDQKFEENSFHSVDENDLEKIQYTNIEKQLEFDENNDNNNSCDSYDYGDDDSY